MSSTIRSRLMLAVGLEFGGVIHDALVRQFKTSWLPQEQEDVLQAHGLDCGHFNLLPSDSQLGQLHRVTGAGSS